MFAFGVLKQKQIYLIFIAGRTKSITVNKKDHKREGEGAVHAHLWEYSAFLVTGMIEGTPASRGWLLAFTKSFARRVCRVVGFLYRTYKASQLRDRQATRRTLLTLKAMHERNLCLQGICTSKISLGAKIWLVFFFGGFYLSGDFFGVVKTT